MGGGILLAHLLVVGLAVSGNSSRSTERPPVFVTFGQIFVQSESPDRVPLPLLTLDAVNVDSQLSQIQFDDSIEEDLGAVIGSVSAPRLSRYQSVDLSVYARRAEVLPSHPVTVILAVSVLEDGRAGSVDVSRSSGNAAADAAAVDYALELRWIPGTRDRIPRAMRILLPVTLSV
jgi:TonB family protein